LSRTISVGATSTPPRRPGQAPHRALAAIEVVLGAIVGRDHQRELQVAVGGGRGRGGDRLGRAAAQPRLAGRSGAACHGGAWKVA
jgi:hypothetical protein